MQETEETQFQSLGQEDHLEEEMATHSSILAWRIPWKEESSGPQTVTYKESAMTERHACLMPASVSLRLLIFLLAILIPACNRSSLASHMICVLYIS